VFATKNETRLDQSWHYGNALGALEDFIRDAFVRGIEYLMQNFCRALDALDRIRSRLIRAADIGKQK
jgi:hypothetical protein